jgi:peptide/nickel transport system ATP-binding protein
VTPLLSVDSLAVDLSLDGRFANALDAVSLDLCNGEALALVGESGCGKTLAALAVVGLLPAAAWVTGGRILMAGRDLTALSEKEMCSVRGREIGFVFQEPALALDPVRSVGSQVVESLRLHRRFGSARTRQIALSLLEEVALPDPIRTFREYPHRLSGGMRQRVMLAIALAADPAVLIADEPTASLDAIVQEEILELLDRLRRSRGLALLLITHDLSAAARHCDRIAVLYAGRIIEEAPAPGFLQHALHPYSRALIACLPELPRPGERRPTRFPAIPGAVPPPGRRGAQECGFTPRCPEVFSACRERVPPLFPRDGGRVRCFLHDPEKAKQ